MTEKAATSAAPPALRPVLDEWGKPISQYQRDLPHPGSAPWKRKPVTVLPVWDPAVGDSVIGEFAGTEDGDFWSGIHDGQSIRLRIAKRVDQPIRISGPQLVRDLIAIKPAIGAPLIFTRSEDQPRWKQRPGDPEPPMVATFTVCRVEADEPDLDDKDA